MTYYTNGEGLLRKEIVEANLKGFALKAYVLKKLLSVVGANGAWKSSYFSEDPTEITAKGTRNIRGIARLADLPVAEVKFEERETIIEKYGLKGFVSWEDAMSDNVPMIARTILRIGRAVVAATDSAIYADIVADANINTENTTAAWDAGSGQNPVKDILSCKRKITDKGYSGEGITLVVNQYDFDMLVLWLMSLGTNAPKIAEKMIEGGKVYELAGVADIMVSDTIAADKALVIKKGEAASWKELAPLQVFLKPDEGIKYEVRAFEFGRTEVVNPGQITLLSNTRA